MQASGHGWNNQELSRRGAALALKAINVVGATIVIQICLLIIMAVGVFLCSHTGRWQRPPYAALLFSSLISMLAISFSDDFYAVWSPMLGDAELFSIGREDSFFLIFFLDMLVASWLIFRTGGSDKSPFTGILFLIPSLAIFLRETPIRFFLYAFLAAMMYVMLSIMARNRTQIPEFILQRGSDSPLPAWWINISSLCLTMYIGYITRPELL